uniref:hypothetical protein n=1 Tax=Photorhabdus heterorhabditis TaxID=880156 RepID=UPI00156222D4
EVLAKLADSNGDGNFWRTITGSVIAVLNNDKVKSPLLKSQFIRGVDKRDICHRLIINGENDGNCR